MSVYSISSFSNILFSYCNSVLSSCQASSRLSLSTCTLGIQASSLQSILNRDVVKNVFSFLCKLDQNAAVKMLQMSIVDSLSLSSSLSSVQTQEKLASMQAAFKLNVYLLVLLILFFLSCSSLWLRLQAEHRWVSFENLRFSIYTYHLKLVSSIYVYLICWVQFSKL
jgi:hypothetical protein